MRTLWRQDHQRSYSVHRLAAKWLDSGLPPSVVTPVKALETVENERSLSGLSKEAQEQHRNATQPKVVR